MKINVHAPHSEKNDDEEHYSNHAVTDTDTAPHDLDGISLCVNVAFQLIVARLQSFLSRRQVFGNSEHFIKGYAEHLADRRDSVNGRGFRHFGKEVLDGGQRHAGSVGNVVVGQFQFFFTDSAQLLNVHLHHLNFSGFCPFWVPKVGLSNAVEYRRVAKSWY
jgi:hypothetical protein